MHPHRGCVVTHREVGVDTDNWHNALKNTLRQAPDVIMIGEIRDQDTMNYAIQFAETGHLCVATLHANSANQALDRIINFFPEERRHQLLMDLSLNITAMISQRLLPRENKMGRVAAMEIMLASPLISDLIFRGEVAMIKDIMAKSTRLGMQTFDQALFQLYEDAAISYEEAMRNADSKNELRLKIKLQSKREGSAAAEQGESLQLAEEEKGSTVLVVHAAIRPSHERQTSFQVDGRQKGVGPFFHHLFARHDQDRRQDHARQSSRADAEDGAPGGARAHERATARALHA